MRSIARVLLAACLVLSAACRGSGGDDGDDGDDAPPPDGFNPNDVSIYDIQNPNGIVPEGTDVNVRGVVVTAIDTYAERANGTRVGTIWVQEPAGGEFSGVLVFGASLGDVANLNVGDIVDITGAAKTEFVLRDMDGNPTDPSGRTTTELEPGSAGSITVTVVTPGGPAPEPQLVDAIAIAGMTQAAKDVEGEKWEGVLIEVRDVSQISDVRMISGEANFLAFQLQGALETDTSLAPFPAGTDLDTCYASIIGVGDYFFEHKIQSRNTADMVTGGTGCVTPAQEEEPSCGDALDNDFDGFYDCEDFSCQASAQACVTQASISQIQMGNITGTVELTNVIVTGVTFNRSNLFVQDAAQAAPYNGIFVFRGGASEPDLPAEIVVGATVNVTGNVTEFMGVTEIVNPTVTFVAAPGALPTPIATSIATLNDPTMGEPFEGVLVQLTNVEVTAFDMGMQKITLSQGADSIIVDDDIYRHTPVLNDCYSTFNGIFHYNNFDTHLNLLPRLATDIVPGGTCN